MNPILLAARLMGDRKMTRRGTAKTESCTIFLWELDDGKVIELIRDTPISGTHCFRSVKERGEPFETLLNYYERGHARVFSPNRFIAA